MVPLVLALATSGWLLAVEGRQGLARDEAQYFRAGERYWGWFEALGDAVRAGKPGQAFSRAVVDSFWGDNHEHPPLMKTLYGLSWRLFHRCDCTGPKRGLHPIAVHKHRTLPLFARESTAFRFPAILLAGLGVALVYGFARRWIGPWAAAGAAVLSVAQPHYFFHAQISCFDAPIAVMAVLVALAYWKSLRSPRWGILCGVFYGFALATKHNAWLIPCFLLVHYLWMRRGDFCACARRASRWPFVSMASLGPIVLFALWPWLWHAPVARTREWVQRHAQHEHYNFEYLGQNWNLPPPRRRPVAGCCVRPSPLCRRRSPCRSPPWPWPRRARWCWPADAARTRPTTSLPSSIPSRPSPARAPRGCGQARTWTWRPAFSSRCRSWGRLATLALPSTPIFGGVKHFLTAMPFLAMVAGVGLAWVTRQAASLVRAPRLRRALPAALAVAAVPTGGGRDPALAS